MGSKNRHAKNSNSGTVLACELCDVRCEQQFPCSRNHNRDIIEINAVKWKLKIVNLRLLLSQDFYLSVTATLSLSIASVLVMISRFISHRSLYSETENVDHSCKSYYTHSASKNIKKETLHVNGMLISPFLLLWQTSFCKKKIKIRPTLQTR